MKLAVIFPGQGSQTVGMGQELAKRFVESKAVFDEVDEALGEKLSDIIFEGPEDKLTLTANAQPALMAVSIAAIRAMESWGFSLDRQVSFVAGHSLGEYSALCACGSLSLSDAARLLRIRGNAMQSVVPPGNGAMAAIIGLKRDVVEDICNQYADDECCQIANDNGGEQWVISGSAPAVKGAVRSARQKGAKRAIPLSVSAPFHSAMMAPAAEIMQEALGQVTLNAPGVPIIANVLAAPIVDPEEIKTRLVEQVTGQVRWRESIEFMDSNGITDTLEVGSGRVLTGLVKRISRNIRGTTISSGTDIEKALETPGRQDTPDFYSSSERHKVFTGDGMNWIAGGARSGDSDLRDR